MSAGYRSVVYADSFGEFGEPVWLSGSRGWLIKRAIPGFPAADAMGCYPLFSCEQWGNLDADLAALDGQLVAVSLVTDPFGNFDPDSLRQWFPDVVTKFKDHHLVALEDADWSTLSKHHRYYARRALKHVRVERAQEPVAHLDEWLDLYGVLVARRGLKGIKAFSRSAFERQLSVPGAVLLIARAGDEIVGAHIWYLDGEIAYSHLAATSARGYELSASYALHWSALEHFRDHAVWLNLGAGAGTTAPGAGLDSFKRGFATNTRPVYFCGRICDRDRYDEIDRKRGAATRYFPRYRAGELA